MFTEVPLEDIQKYENVINGEELNEAKVLLADEATKLLHGAECLPSIHNAIQSLFGSGGGDLESIPKLILTSDDFKKSGEFQVADLLAKSKLTLSKAEGRRMIKGGGVKVNDSKIEDENYIVTTAHLDDKGRLKLSCGKKKHVVVYWPASK